MVSPLVQETNGLRGVKAPGLWAEQRFAAMTDLQKIRCDACPVMCFIAPGQTGACDRYANDAGRIAVSYTHLDVYKRQPLAYLSSTRRIRCLHSGD